MKQVTARVTNNDQILEGITHRSGLSISSVHLIWLDCPEIAREAKPGQFVMVRCGEESVLPRPFSIHQLADGSKLALLFNVVGKGTNWLSQCKIGDNIDLLGPLGNGFFIKPSSHKLLLLAGGIGIAPLRFLADEALMRECSVRLLLGASTATQLYPKHLLPSGIEFSIVTEDGTAGKKGMITDLLPDFADWADQIFACGPTEMYRDMARRKQELKLKAKSIQVSLEVRMGCGRGVCYGCTLKTKGGLKQVCTDGPVFDLDDILWDELNY